MSFVEEVVLIAVLALVCWTLFMMWRKRILARYPYATLYLASFVLLNPLRWMFCVKFGFWSTENFLAYWLGDYVPRLLVSLAAVQFIELALEESRLQIGRSTFLLARLIVVVVSGFVLISYYIPRLTNPQGRSAYKLFLYFPSTLLIFLAWIAYRRCDRSELQPRLLIAAIGLNSAINMASLAMHAFSLTVGGRTQFLLNFTLPAEPIAFLVMELLWLYAAISLDPPNAIEARERELVRASGSLSVLAAVFSRAKEET